jgi:competence protein ComEC
MLVWIAAAFSSGIAIGDWLALGTASSLFLVIAASGALIFARIFERQVGIPALLLAASLGAASQGARPRAPPGLVDGLPWTVEGELLQTERSFGRTRVLIDLVAVERGELRRSATGRVAVSLDGDPVEQLLPGDRVRFLQSLHVPRGFANPGAPDAARRAATDGVMAVTGLHDPAALIRLAGDSGGPLRRIARWRARLLDAIRRHLDGERRALVASLVVGDRGEIARALDDDFRTAGVSHVLSVSGLHLAVAAWLFYTGLVRLLLRLGLGLGRPVRRFAAAAALPAIVVYTFLTGAQVATVRACVVAIVWLAAVALDRRATAAGALALAALGVLLASPLELFDPSFQLSFAAALGTSLLSLPLSSGPTAGPGLRFVRWTARLCVASLAAIAATLPIGAFHFSQVAPMGMLSNLVVVPLAELGIVPIGLCGAVLAALPGGGWPGGLLLQLAGCGAAWMAGFVRWFAGWAPSWHVATPGAVEIVAWYGALVCLALGGRWRRWALLCAFIVAASVTGHALSRHFSTTLRATFLDVGQGDACVLELPRGHAVVIDGGGSFDPSFDPGREVVAPFLWRRGIRRIDLVVMSHPHPDHANGLPSLVDQFAVGEIWTNGQESRLPALLKLHEAATKRGVPFGTPRALSIGGVALRPLAPLDEHGQVAPDAAWGENDNSLVLEVAYRGRKLLFTGDVEREAESRLATGPVDVVKVPHHGSRTSSTPPLVDATHPSLAVISVGERNRWGFPAPSVVARWTGAGARLLRTDRDGAVIVSVDGSGALGEETVLK